MLVGGEVAKVLSLACCEALAGSLRSRTQRCEGASLSVPERKCQGKRAIGKLPDLAKRH